MRSNAMGGLSLSRTRGPRKYILGPDHVIALHHIEDVVHSPRAPSKECGGMSYRDVRGAWWPGSRGRTRESGAPLISVIGSRFGLRHLLPLLAGWCIAWVVADAGYWLLFARDPALRLDPAMGLVPISSSQSLNTTDGHSYQLGFNAFGSVVLPTPNVARRRVMLLGDSEVSCYSVDRGDQFGTLLARRFPDVQFTCIAQPGYSVADYLRIAQSMNGFADYDAVVIVGCELDVGNEALDGSRGRGLAVAHVDGDGVHIRSEAVGWDGRHLELYNRLHRFDAMGHCVQKLGRGLMRIIAHPRAGRHASTMAPGGQDLSATRPLLETLRRDVSPPIVWVYLTKIQGVGDRRRVDLDSGPPFLDECRRQGFLVVDPTSSLLEYRSASGGYANGVSWTQPGTGHLNADGHRLLYRAVEPVLARLLESDPRRR
jgi:hypothetical protein